MDIHFWRKSTFELPEVDVERERVVRSAPFRFFAPKGPKLTDLYHGGRLSTFEEIVSF